MFVDEKVIISNKIKNLAKSKFSVEFLKHNKS